MTGEVARRLATAALRPGLPRSSFLRKQESRVGRGRPVGLRPGLPRSSFLRKQESRVGRGRPVGLRPGLPRSSFLRKQESRMRLGRPAALRPVLSRSSFLRKQESRMRLGRPAARHSSRFHGNGGPGCVGTRQLAKPIAGHAVIMVWHGTKSIRRKPAVSGSWHANTFRDCLDR